MDSLDLSCVAMFNNHIEIFIYSVALNQCLYASVDKTCVCIKIASEQFNFIVTLIISIQSWGFIKETNTLNWHMGAIDEY